MPWSQGGVKELFAQHMRVSQRFLFQRFGTCVPLFPLAASVFCAALAGAAFAAAPPPLPPGATPGGALPPPIPDALFPPTPELGAFPVPPAVERPLGVEEGDRVFVGSFDLKGIAERPAKGIVLQEIEDIIENLRLEKQGLKEIGDDGFTPGETEQVAMFMRKVVDNPDLDMLFEEYQALVDKLRLEKLKRDAGMTIGQMQQVADAITEYYRNAGFVLAQAYIPAQEVQDGVVVIEVLEGRLGNVLAEGNEKFSAEVLARPFGDLIDAPLTAESLESSILTVGDLPGLSVFGVLQPGQAVGTSDLVLRVQEEKPFDVTLRADNHGTRFTGKRRAYADFTWNNPIGRGDRLTGTLLQTFMPKNSLFGSVEYETPIFVPGMTVGASYARNAFDVGAEQKAQGLSGSSKIAEGYFKHAFLRQRTKNLYGKVGLSRKTALTRAQGAPRFRDKLAMLQAEVSFDSIDAETQGINLGTIGYAHGLPGFLGTRRDGEFVDEPRPTRYQDPTDNSSESKFRKFTASYSRLQRLTDTQTLLLRLEGQYSRSLLSSLEQFPLGGPASVRAFNISEYLGDRGFFASLEWGVAAPGFADKPAFKNLTWGEVLRVSFFADYGKAYLNSPTASDIPNLALAGYGAGIQVSMPGQFTARLQAAHPFGRKVPGRITTTGTGDPKARRNQYWFDFTYNF